MQFYDLERLSIIMKLSPYQDYIVRNNQYKYNIRGLRKKGSVLLAPYKNENLDGFREGILRILHGPKADLIGSDKILVFGQRGIKIFPTGHFTAKFDGKRCRADADGNVIGG